MEAIDLHGSQPTFCAQVNKVYDWVTNNFDYTTMPLSASADSIALFPPTVACSDITSVTCSITSVTATPGARTDVDFVIDGATVTLQSVVITKTVTFTITVNYTSATGSGSFSFPVTTTLTETVILCAPAGTTIDITLSPNSTCNVLTYTCTPDTGTPITGITVTLSGTLCQNIIVTYPAVVELTETLCTPREEILPTCPSPTLPPQCPLVFGPPPVAGTGA